MRFKLGALVPITQILAVSAAFAGGNLLEGFSTRFEHGCAGWQPFVLPHYPAVAVPAEYDTSNPGEGSASLVIRSGNGVNCMPIPAARAESTVTLSFLARAEQPMNLVMRMAHSDGTLWDQVVSVGTTWSRRSATYTIRDPDLPPFVFIENRGNGTGTGPSAFIDAISLNSGTDSTYIAPAQELVLQESVGGAAATLICADANAAAGTWRWVVEDMLPEAIVVGTGTVSWTPAGGGIHRAEISIPAEAGLYRVILQKAGGSGGLEPMRELIVARDTFTGLEGNPDTAPLQLGLHAHHNLKDSGNPAAPLSNTHPAWNSFLGRLRHAGASWLRLHGGRPDILKMAYLFPHSLETAPVAAQSALQPYRDLGFKLLGVVDTGFRRMSHGEEWYEYETTQGEWMTDRVPKDIEIWKDYVRQASQAYESLFDAWEIFNEPNGRMQASFYVPLLEAAYPILKSVSPGKPVVGISTTADFDANLEGFFSECADLGAGASLDAVSIHPYVGLGSSSASLSHMRNMTQAMTREGVGDKALWISEIGWPCSPGYASHRERAPGTKAISASLGAAHTARNLVNAVRAGASHYFIWSGMGAFFGWQGGGAYSPFFEYDGTSSAHLLATGTVMRLLDGAVFSSQVSLASGKVEAFLFEKNGGTLLAIWGSQRYASPVVAEAPDRVWNIAGKALPASAALPAIGSFPVYLEWDDKSPAAVATMLGGISWSLLSNPSPPTLVAPQSPSNTGTPVFHGTAPANSSVAIKRNGVTVAHTTTDIDGNWSYQPHRTLDAGSYVFQVVAEDSAGLSTPASANATFTFDPDLPNVHPETLARSKSGATRIAVAELLSNDSDPNGRTLGVTAFSATSTQGGTVSRRGGWLTYTPPAGLGDSTVDSFSYTVSNGVRTVSTSVLLQVPGAENRLSATMLSIDVNPLGPGKAVVFAAIPSLVYEIRASSDLAQWTSLGLHTADSLGRVTLLDTGAVGASRFYTLSHQRNP